MSQEKWDKFLKLYGVIGNEIEPEEIMDYIIKIRNENKQLKVQITK